MSTNRTDSGELRTSIRMLVGLAKRDLETDALLTLQSGEKSARPAIQYLDTLLEDLDDYEAKLPKIIQSTRAQASNVVDE